MGGVWDLPEEEESKVVLYCLVLQIENPRYLRENPVPLSPVSADGS